MRFRCKISAKILSFAKKGHESSFNANRTEYFRIIIHPRTETDNEPHDSDSRRIAGEVGSAAAIPRTEIQRLNTIK